MEKIQRRESKDSKVVEVGKVRVCKEIDIVTLDWQKPTIDWPALGSVSIAEAKEFLSDLQTAIDEAEKLA